MTDLAVRFPEAKLVPDEAVVLNDLAKVTRFVDKPTEGFDLLLDLRGMIGIALNERLGLVVQVVFAEF